MIFNKLQLTFYLALLIAIGSNCHAQKSNDSINAYLDSVVLRDNIPGISAGILVDGELYWTGASGYADVENKIEAKPETLFRIGSINKVLTATAILKLSENGSIDLQAPIQTYLPDYPISKKGEIKTIHLLNHTSGIAHYKGKENRSFVKYDNLRDACRIFESRTLKFKPGTRYMYTSYGYTVLGAIMESVTKKSYYDAMKELIFDPAEMTSTFLDNRTKSNTDLAKLYTKKGDQIKPDVNNDLSNIYPAGGLVSTTTDLLKFVDAWKKNILLSEESNKMMLETPLYNGKVLDENAGIGWNIWQHNKYGLVYHRIGGQSGTSALLLSYSETGVTVILLSNQAVLDPIWEITNRLIGFGLSSKN
ncbi:serine hydrolase domain-containing protein [Winogradskyella sp. A2]|uniref:serine hydrolase domain-containing protein n=1 Tax=Winogradskyella sp. A2 TaxID=3366944 RepID=UPI00398C5588